jgi:hypothetical protein
VTIKSAALFTLVLRNFRSLSLFPARHKSLLVYKKSSFHDRIRFAPNDSGRNNHIGFYLRRSLMRNIHPQNSYEPNN